MNVVEIGLIASSNPENGAVKISSGGDQFSVFYNNPINIPGANHGFNYVDIAAQATTLWYNFPNITSENNNFRITIGVTVFNVTIAEGLYTLDDLNESIDREIESLGGDTTVYQFQADTPTDKVNIFLAGTVGTPVQIDFTIANSIRTILGFDSQLVPPAPATTDYNQLGDSIANFNQINSVLVHTDLVDSGIRIGSSFNSALQQVYLTTAPNFQQISEPFNLQWVAADALRGKTRTEARFWITDEQNRPLNTRGEFWDVNFVIRAHRHIIPKLKL